LGSACQSPKGIVWASFTQFITVSFC
jgi:hypothetical protein